MAYEIEKNIPLIGIEDYPFSKMEVGDSFAAPKKESVKLRTRLNYNKSKLNMEFKTRIIGSVIRCWRIK